MSDDISEAIGGLRDKMQQMDSRLESIQAELRPMTKLFSGNGRPSLEARLYHLEQQSGLLGRSAAWSARFAIGALVCALGSLLWSALSRVQ